MKGAAARRSGAGRYIKARGSRIGVVANSRILQSSTISAMRPLQFGADITNQAAMHCTRMAGRAIIRVVGRCNDAQENSNLDLSHCELMQVPDAVYHLMRHTQLKGCNLSSNVITKITPKLAVKFSLITELNLSKNMLSKLPDELADLSELVILDISSNAYISLPNVAYKIPKLNKLIAHSNHIVEVDVERLQAAPSLTDVDLQNNPLPPRLHSALKAITAPRIQVSDREIEDWEDLNV